MPWSSGNMTQKRSKSPSGARLIAAKNRSRINISFPSSRPERSESNLTNSLRREYGKRSATRSMPPQEESKRNGDANHGGCGPHITRFYYFCRARTDISADNRRYEHGQCLRPPNLARNNHKVSPRTDISLSREIVRLAIFRDKERNPPSCAVSASCDSPKS